MISCPINALRGGHRCLDTARGALRQYRPVLPQTGIPARATRLPVEIRRFPWIKRLAADYAHDYARVADFFAGNPAEPAAWRDAIARAQRHPRQRAAIADVVQAQQRRRSAPPEAIAASARLRDASTVADRHRPAGGTVRRPALHAAQGADDDSARRAGGGRARRPDRGGLLDRCGGPRLGRGQVVWRARSRPESGGGGNRHPAGRGRRARSPGPAGRFSARSDGHACSRCCSRPSSPPHSSIPCAASTALGPAWRTPSDSGWSRCSARAGWWCSIRPILPPSRSPRRSSPGSSSTRAPPRAWQPTPERGLSARGYHAQVTPQEDHAALFHLDGLRAPIRTSDAPALGRPRAVAAGRVQPERAAAAARAGHALSHRWVRGRTERAGLSRPAPRRVRGLRRADAADVSARLRDHCRLQRDAIPRSSRYEFRVPATRRMRARSTSCSRRRFLPRSTMSMDEAVRTVSERMEGLARVVVPLDSTLEGAVRSAAGRMQDDLEKLHGEDHAGHEAQVTRPLRRQFKQRAGAGVSRRPPAGAGARIRALPQQVRLCARRSADGGPPAGAGHALGDGDLTRATKRRSPWVL